MTAPSVLRGEEGARPRHYRLLPGYDPDRAWPLVIMMPGHRVDIYSLADYTQLEATAEANGFILAYAEKSGEATPSSGPGGPTGHGRQRRRATLTSPFCAGSSMTWPRGGASTPRGLWRRPLPRRGDGLHRRTRSRTSPRSAASRASSSSALTRTWRAPGRRHRSCSSTASSTRTCRWCGVTPCTRQSAGRPEEALVYHRLDNVAHRWQPWMNQQVWGG